MERWNGTIADKDRFHREGKRALRQVAKYLGLQRGQYTIHSNRAGCAVGGEISLHTDKLYLWISGSTGHGACYVIGRKCHGRRDYGSGLDCPNHDFEWELLYNPASLADVIRLEGLVAERND